MYSEYNDNNKCKGMQDWKWKAFELKDILVWKPAVEVLQLHSQAKYDAGHSHIHKLILNNIMKSCLLTHVYGFIMWLAKWL